MTILRNSVLILLVVLIAGCVTGRSGKGTAVIPTQPPFTITPVYRLPMQAKDIPTDATVVVEALLGRMALNANLPKGVTFDPRGQHQILDPGFDYSGFGVRAFDLMRYDAVTTDKDTFHIDMTGLVHLQDGIDRRTSVVISAEYKINRAKARILSSSVRPLQPAFPRVECFFVPESALKSVSRGSLQSFADWYAFARNKAISMVPTQDDRNLYTRWQTLSEAEKKAIREVQTRKRFIILAFAMNRILDPGTLSLGFCDTPGTLRNTSKSTVLNFSGWRVASMGAELTIDDLDHPYFVQVMYSPDPESTGKGVYPVLAGLFSTTKNYTPKTVKSSSEQKNSRFLNPSNSEDAKLIQQRLSELGYYKAAIDGDFGKGSRTALKKFKQQQGLGENSNWDFQTQQRLFP